MKKVVFMLMAIIITASTYITTGTATIPETSTQVENDTFEEMHEPAYAQYYPVTLEYTTNNDAAIDNGETPEVLLNENDVEYLACVIYQEAGGDNVCDLCRYRVADIVLNRVNDTRYTGSSIHDILIEPYQWGLYYKTGIVWPESAKLDSETNAVERARRIAEDVLLGHHSDLTSDYIWCAEFPQGTDIIECDGIYYGK